MKVAVLIGVSKYVNENDLPGCENDIMAMEELIIGSKEYDEIKTFKKNESSSEIKTSLTELFTNLKGKKIDELFFYFTGHGSYDKEEFFHLLSDFDDGKRRQTSLENSEVDDMIKSIKPSLVIKVIDACQSGVSYIKGNTNIVKEYYSKTSEKFNDCYFLHSSMTNQNSYQDEDLSGFTKSFLNSIRKSNEVSIRYRDIISHISDEFEGSSSQTPFFTTQGGFGDTFLTKSEKIDVLLDKYLNSEKDEDVEENLKDTIKYSSFIDRIKKEAEDYSTEEDVKELLGEITECVTSFSLNTEIKDLFRINTTFEHAVYDLPNRAEIGRWLKQNEHDFFAKEEYESVAYEEEQKPNPMGGLKSYFEGNKIITKYKKTLCGFKHTVMLDYKSMTISFLPQHPNLQQYGAVIAFLVSKKDIKFFYAFTNYFEEDWNTKIMSKNFEWKSASFNLKEKLKIVEFIEGVLRNSELRVLSILKTGFEIE